MTHNAIFQILQLWNIETKNQACNLTFGTKYWFNVVVDVIELMWDQRWYINSEVCDDVSIRQYVEALR